MSSPYFIYQGSIVTLSRKPVEWAKSKGEEKVRKPGAGAEEK
jgi:hypothetical protein